MENWERSEFQRYISPISNLSRHSKKQKCDRERSSRAGRLERRISKHQTGVRGPAAASWRKTLNRQLSGRIRASFAARTTGAIMRRKGIAVRGRLEHAQRDEAHQAHHQERQEREEIIPVQPCFQCTTPHLSLRCQRRFPTPRWRSQK